jgi:hypothetical protein
LLSKNEHRLTSCHIFTAYIYFRIELFLTPNDVARLQLSGRAFKVPARASELCRVRPTAVSCCCLAHVLLPGNTLVNGTWREIVRHNFASDLRQMKRCSAELAAKAMTATVASATAAAAAAAALP